MAFKNYIFLCSTSLFVLACSPVTKLEKVSINGKSYEYIEEYSVGSFAGKSDSSFTLKYKGQIFRCSGFLSGCIEQAQEYDRSTNSGTQPSSNASGKADEPADTRGD